MNELYQEIRKLHESNAYHIRRGFRLKENTIISCTNHLLEEIIEAQAELLEIKRANYLPSTTLVSGEEAVKEEIVDVCMIFYHLLMRLNLPVAEIEQKALAKLKKNFTLDPNKVTAISPGTTRRGRV